MFFDLAHGGVDLAANVRRLGEGEQVVEAGLGGEVKDVSGVVGGGFVDATGAAGGGPGLFEGGPEGGEADLGEAEEDEAEDGAGVFLGLEAGVGAKLIGGGPEALFERGRGGVFFGGGDPVHRQMIPRGGEAKAQAQRAAGGDFPQRENKRTCPG